MAFEATHSQAGALPARQLDALCDAMVAITKAIEVRDPDAVAHGFLGGAHGYGAHWDTEVFQMRPFYWGDCDCGAVERGDAWFEANPHAADCYSVELRRREAAYDEESGYNALYAALSAPGMVLETTEQTPLGTMFASFRSPEGEVAHKAWCASYDARTKAHRKISLQLCRERRIPWNKGRGSGCHCTCGRDQLAKPADIGHRDTCSIVLPNFRHKATGFEVRWYKYIGRGMETTGDVPDVASLLSECLADIAPR